MRPTFLAITLAAMAVAGLVAFATTWFTGNPILGIVVGVLVGGTLGWFAGTIAWIRFDRMYEENP